MMDHGNTQSQHKVKMDDRCACTKWAFVGVGGWLCMYTWMCVCVCVYLYPGVFRLCVNIVETVHTRHQNVSPVTTGGQLSLLAHLQFDVMLKFERILFFLPLFNQKPRTEGFQETPRNKHWHIELLLPTYQIERISCAVSVITDNYTSITSNN